MLVYIIVVALLGLVTGALARLALPGPDPMSLLQTMLVGVGGSLIAGLIFYAISGGEVRGAGFLASFTCSVVIVYIIRRRRGGDLTHPSGDRHR